jgi:1-acyl-sn-glycerol-3-phosphate acyltransferase
MRRNRLARVSYWAVVYFIRLCTFLYVRGPEVHGRENVPRTGGAILVSNHLNNADPCVIPGALNRRVVSMAKKEMFKWPVVNILFLMIGAFPVDREGADLGALREAQRTVNSGLLLLMFPEGTRSRDRQLKGGFPGSALVAYRTGVPLIPVAVTGTESLKWPFLFFRPFIGPKVTIRFGPPFYPPAVQRITTQAAKEATDDIMVHIAELLPVEYQGQFREAVAARAASLRARTAAAETV